MCARVFSVHPPTVDCMYHVHHVTRRYILSVKWFVSFTLRVIIDSIPYVGYTIYRVIQGWLVCVVSFGN